MTGRPIFVATHPRACSTAFERVFITRRDILDCAHEPFGEPFYYGPEFLSDRYRHDEAGRKESGHANTTYGDIMDQLLTQKEGKRVFVKDMAYYLIAPDGKPTDLFPSLLARLPGGRSRDAVEVEGGGFREPGNPSGVPRELLREFHFAFLIRHPRRSVPSYYRCFVPPLNEVTGWSDFLPNEAGYVELRRFFDFLREEGMVGPRRSGDGEEEEEEEEEGANGAAAEGGQVRITIVDADDLLDKPSEVIRTFCKDVGIDFTQGMLDWDDESTRQAVEAFAKWKGFHEDALGSSSLKPRTHAQKAKTEEQEDEEWRGKFGEEAAKIMRKTVNDNVEHYEYLKQFAIKV